MGDFEVHFIQEQEIEVGNDDEGFQGSWYAAKVVQTPLTTDKKLLVEYMTLMEDVESSKPLQEYVDTFIVRPRPPQEEERFFEHGELVEAYHNDGWWEGTIAQVHDNLKYSVHLRALVEELEFQQSEIRSHHQWIGGRWVGDQELQTLETSFYVGASVEVCLDDENCRDAWFPAVILNRINNSSFLVEYQTSRFQNMVGKINETVDLLHIRPFPPNTSQDKSFDLLEKVDAFYNCGWWSGVINRVLAGSRYIVFLKHQREQREFSHSELRFHIDWIDGKWIQNFKEISPQGRIEAPGQVKSAEAGKTDQNIEVASWCVEDAAKIVAIEKSSGQVQSEVVGKIDENIDMGSRCGEDAAKNAVVENSPGQVQSGDVGNTDHNIDMTSQCGEDAAKNVAVEKSPRQVKSGDAGKTGHNIDMASQCDEDAAKNVAVEKSPGQEQYGEAGTTVESIDMASRCGEDAAKNFGIEKSPEQAQHHTGNQSSPSKLGSPGQRQSHQVESSDQIIDIAVTPSGNAAKTVVSKKSPSFRNSRKIDYQSTPDKVNSASYIINSCKTQRKMQLTSESDTDSIITREKRKKMQATPENVTNSIITRVERKKMQSTPENVTNSIITREERKKMQSTPENVTDSIITREKRKKMQSTPENDTVPSRTKLKSAEIVKTPLAPCRAKTMATRVLTETDWQLDFATQTTKGQGDNVGGKSSSESTEVKRAESPILAEMILNCSKEGYKDHTKDLNSGEEQLKHVLESNGSRNQSSVEGSSHLPQNIIDVEQYEVVNLPKTQVPARPLKLRIRPTRQKGEPLAHDDIKQETTEGGSKQTSNVSDRKRKAKVSISKALVKDVEHSGTVGIQAPVLASTDVQSKDGDHNAAGESSQAIETQTKGLEQTTPSKEIINFVVQREDATKETDMDWALSNIGDLHQPPIHYLKDSPIRGSEVQNSLDIDVSSFSFGGTTANKLLDQAIGDEVSERIQQSFLICSSADQMLQEDESFPFIKCSPVWETVESLEVFRVMPQRLHFRPLEQFDMYLRDGLAIGSMVNFANIVEEVGKAKLDDPPSILQKWSDALENFKAYGFNVQPIQARLETLRRIKDEQAKLNEELMEAEGQISMILAEKISVEAELDEHNKKIRELQEYLNQLIKKREQTILKKEVQDSSIAELKKSIDNATECIHSVTSEFRTAVATPW